jgi:hypothetical protein
VSALAWILVAALGAVVVVCVLLALALRRSRAGLHTPSRA